MDFFTVPVTFRTLYVWFVIGHARRRILHFEVTGQPAPAWLIQQLREAFPFDAGPRHLIFDRDSSFSAEVVSTVKSFGIKPTRTGWRCPWQNGVAERWVGSVCRELLDHVVVIGERHLRRLVRDYVAYDHDDRTHLGLGKATPAARLVERRPKRRSRGSRAATCRRPPPSLRLACRRVGGFSARVARHVRVLQVRRLIGRARANSSQRAAAPRSIAIASSAPTHLCRLCATRQPSIGITPPQRRSVPSSAVGWRCGEGQVVPSSTCNDTTGDAGRTPRS